MPDRMHSTVSILGWRGEKFNEFFTKRENCQNVGVYNQKVKRKGNYMSIRL